MQRLEFTPEEIQILREVLEHNVKEIDVEVFRTDTHDFKELLKHRREVLQRLLERMTEMAAAA